MSIKLNKATFLNKKLKLQEVTFKVDKSEISNVVINDKIKFKQFKNILLGKYPLEQSNFYLNNYEVASKRMINQTLAVIGKSNFLSSLFPIRISLFFNLLFNLDFIKQAKTAIYSAKYDYLSYKTTNNNKTDIEMRNAVYGKVQSFIDSSVNIERKWLDEFSFLMNKFIDDQTNKHYKNFKPYLSKLINEYSKLKEDTRNSSLMVTYLQSLRDKVFSFIELRFTCTCEYNAKHSNDQEIKKLAKFLNFNQHIFLIRKHLKLIDIEVNQLKRKIAQKRIILKLMKRAVYSKVTSLYDVNDNKNRKEIWKEFLKEDEWKKLKDDQYFEFRKKQENMFFRILPDEANIIRGKIIEIMHAYHNKVFSNQLENKDLNEYKKTKLELKKRKTSLFKYANTYIQNIFESLDIHVNWFTTKTKFSGIDHIYLKLINSLNKNKNNIVFENIISNLSLSDYDNFLNSLNLVFSFFPNTSIVFLSKKISNATNLKNNLYLDNQDKIESTDFEKLIEINYEKYLKDYFMTFNRLSYKQIDDNNILTAFGKMNVKLQKINNEGTYFLNPFKIFLDKKNLGKNFVEVNVQIKKDKVFKDNNMRFGLAKNGSKFIFYSSDNLKLESKQLLYIQEESIIDNI
ncbi:hypothetical protein [Spiroplasma endosymbiont of Labia minor]|uniref:hypothetical protein n=1 Tax=Spiroplasma endosymbiont of Labia minor TaxID=3066305 RepID=UPI0030D47A57